MFEYYCYSNSDSNFYSNSNSYYYFYLIYIVFPSFKFRWNPPPYCYHAPINFYDCYFCYCRHQHHHKGWFNDGRDWDNRQSTILHNLAKNYFVIDYEGYRRIFMVVSVLIVVRYWFSDCFLPTQCSLTTIISGQREEWLLNSVVMVRGFRLLECPVVLV